jgi:hypothetical protein
VQRVVAGVFIGGGPENLIPCGSMEASVGLLTGVKTRQAWSVFVAALTEVFAGSLLGRSWRGW